MDGSSSPTIVIGREVDGAHGWSYEVTIERGDGGSSRHEVHLAWVDYEQWSSGEKPPSVVIEHMLGLVFDLEPGFTMGDRVDAATLRRRFPALDRELADRL